MFLALISIVYDSDSILIPKNTSVIVARVPVANVKKNWNKNDSNSKNVIIFCIYF